MMAPIGAVAYTVKLTKDGATLFFAMIKKGENGLTALKRIRKDFVAPGGWIPTTARPEEQHFVTDTPELTKCELVEKDGNFLGKTEPAQAFLELMRQVANLPVRATADMGAKKDELK